MLQADGSRVLLDCGPGVLGRLREHSEWPDVDAIAITHWHLDHWGDLVPWVWGSFYLAARRPSLTRRSGFSLAEPSSSPVSASASASRTCSSARSISPSTSPTRRSRSATSPSRRPGFPTTASRPTRSACSRTAPCSTYSGDSAPSAELVESARDADLFVCEATLLRGELDGEPRGHLSLDEAVEAFEASGAKRLLVTHRPRELPTPGRVRARVRRSRARDRLARAEVVEPARRPADGDAGVARARIRRVGDLRDARPRRARFHPRLEHVMPLARMSRRVPGRDLTVADASAVSAPLVSRYSATVIGAALTACTGACIRRPRSIRATAFAA